jgi:hypothetical protein
MLTIERVCLTVAHRWWDFGADAYVVRHITAFSSFLPENLSDLRSLAEFQQIRSVDTQCPIADGTYSWRQVSSLIFCIPQGWLWSRLPLTATNFIIELEFKVCSIASPDIYRLLSCGRYPAATHAFSETALPCG